MRRIQHLRRFGGDGLWTRRAAMAVCLMLLALVTFVQVAHVHPATVSSAAGTDQCPICVVMHSAAPVSVASATVTFVSTFAPVAVPSLNPVVRPWDCTLFNRPPPSLS